jgi:hypothetical protein
MFHLRIPCSVDAAANDDDSQEGVKKNGPDQMAHRHEVLLTEMGRLLILACHATDTH